MKKWLPVFCLTLGLLILGLAINEYLLLKAKHLKSIVNDEDLWALEREKIDDLTSKDIVLLGASRMQGNIDIPTLKEELGGKVIQLAFAGKGSSLPMFKDIVQTTGFHGLIIVDEVQMTLSDTITQGNGIIKHYHDAFSFDRKLNKLISVYLQERLLFLNPNSNSALLWGTLLSSKRLPPPTFTLNLKSRQQDNYFNLTDINYLYKYRMDEVSKRVQNAPMDSSQWLNKIQSWKPWINRFRQKGGRIVFVHMPFPLERWSLENSWMPRNKYWDKAMSILKVPSLHFADYPQLQGFVIPDTSHLDEKSKRSFTHNLSNLISEALD